MKPREQIPLSSILVGARVTAAFSVLLLGCTMALAYPERIQTKGDIQRAKADADDIDIRNLPLECYPLLAKFKQVQQIRLANLNPNVATDEKIEALSQLGFTNLWELVLTNCRGVTDAGVRSLTRIRSLKGIGFEGTSITDASCELIARQTRLDGVNVSNCRNITKKGLLSLATSERLRSIGFSANHLQPEDVVEIIRSCRNITRIEVVDPEAKL